MTRFRTSILAVVALSAVAGCDSTEPTPPPAAPAPTAPAPSKSTAKLKTSDSPNVKLVD